MKITLTQGRIRNLTSTIRLARAHGYAKGLARVVAGLWMWVFIFALAGNITSAQAPPAGKAEKPIAPTKPLSVYATFSGDVDQCMTNDRAVLAHRLKVPLVDFNEYMDRKDKTGPPKTARLAETESIIKKYTPKGGFANPSKDYLCPKLGNGHQIAGGKVCLIWAGMPMARSPVPSDRVRTWHAGPIGKMINLRGCDYKNGGAVIPFAIYVCQHYAMTKLGLKKTDFSTFVRWNAHSFDTVCFFIEKSNIESLMESIRKKEWQEILRQLKAMRDSRRKRILIKISRSTDIEKIAFKIQKEADKDFVLEFPHTTPLVGKRLVDLARVDPESAAKYMSWLRSAMSPKHYSWNPEKMRKTVLGHDYNIRKFRKTLILINKDIKDHRKLLDYEYKEYLREKNAPKKALKYSIYIAHTKKHDALKELGLAVDELIGITIKKKLLVHE